MKMKYMKNKYLAFWLPIEKNKIDVIGQNAGKFVASFQVCLRATLVIGQIFSLIPVNGVWSERASDVKFVWSSWKCTYSFLSLLGQIFITCMCIHKVLHSASSLNGINNGSTCPSPLKTLLFILTVMFSLVFKSPIIFYSTTCITMMLFLKVARKWPELVKDIAKIEDLDPYHQKNLAYKCNATCFIVLSLALLEHILSLLSAVAGALACHSNGLSYKKFVTHFYPWVFNFLPYSLGLGVLTQFLHFQSTFIWNFSDLFVICMSYYLTARLDHVNQKLLNAQGKYLPEVFWRTTREDYGRAVQLVRKVDEVISGIIFISFANNLFFICLQLFNTLEDGIKGQAECSNLEKGKTNLLGGYEAALYFLFSLFYLIARSVAVSLIASQVNSASTVPAPVLYDVPSPVYCVEVQRFLDQVNGDKVALSGLQFFNVTKGLLLTVAGTIVTYELVMFQFNASPPTLNATTTTSAPPNMTTPVFSLNDY